MAHSRVLLAILTLTTAVSAAGLAVYCFRPAGPAPVQQVVAEQASAVDASVIGSPELHRAMEQVLAEPETAASYAEADRGSADYESVKAFEDGLPPADFRTAEGRYEIAAGDPEGSRFVPLEAQGVYQQTEELAAERMAFETAHQPPPERPEQQR